MLSIRTQDRTALVPYDGIIKIKKDHAINAHSVSSVEIYKGYSIVCDVGILGTYKTEERALEVLDEIQVYVVGKILIPNEMLKDKKLDYINKGLIMPIGLLEAQTNSIEVLPLVYEMPKESE